MARGDPAQVPRPHPAAPVLGAAAPAQPGPFGRRHLPALLGRKHLAQSRDALGRRLHHRLHRTAAPRTAAAAGAARRAHDARSAVWRLPLDPPHAVARRAALHRGRHRARHDRRAAQPPCQRPAQFPVHRRAGRRPARGRSVAVPRPHLPPAKRRGAEAARSVCPLAHPPPAHHLLCGHREREHRYVHGGFQLVNLQLPPFGLPEPDERLRDWVAGYAERWMLLYRREAIESWWRARA